VEVDGDVGVACDVLQGRENISELQQQNEPAKDKHDVMGEGSDQKITMRVHVRICETENELANILWDRFRS
jgi:hypothetical protein